MSETTIMEAIQHSYIDYLIYLLVGFGGVVAHCLNRARSLNIDYEKANMQLSFGDYLKKDKYGIMLSFLAVFLWLALFGEAAQKYPAILSYTRLSFFLMGGAGSYAIQAIISKAKKELRQEIDYKTNTLDELTNTNMEHWVFQPQLSSSQDVVNSIGNQQYGIAASAMSNQTQGNFYTEQIGGGIYLCAKVSAFSTPINANITPVGSQQSGIHVPIKRPR